MKKLTLAILMTLTPMVYAGGAPSANADKIVGDAEAGKAKSMVCASCHGADGNTALMPEYPKLGGQHASYIGDQLHQFKSGVRNNAIMLGQVAALSDQDMADLAAYYASQPVAVGGASENLVEQGQAIYRAGVVDKGIPACTSCHGPQGLGNPTALYPSLSGQNAAYTMKQLKDYQSGERIGDTPTNNQKIMIDIAKKLSDADMTAVADYVSGLH
ncbi:c-type cytochrome [Candidatus Albibeggiatoa sp. nov. NOAA]|uniref:c-type cytochrome n=1 Tax=Candidatus Albibeggiatoa sp. nov. NOAA TaxID=3162724 RepID=UPI0032FBD8E3|nr:cytochrome c4 [Thiotrichaceae bacterium]